MIDFKRLYADLKKKYVDKNKFALSDLDFFLAGLLGKSRNDLKLLDEIENEYLPKILSGVYKLSKNIPLDIILGYTEFYDSKILISKNVLTPRFETELLVEKVILKAREMFQDTKKKIDVLDMCSGSGAIGISIKKELGEMVNVTCADKSKKALKLSQKNAKLNEVDINFVHTNMFENISQKYDIIVSNPPYISKVEYSQLESRVKHYDPKMSLYGGVDGLEFYRIIKDNDSLKEKGYIFLEIGNKQGEDVKNIFSKYRNIQVLKDLEKKDRIVVMEK